MHVLNEDAVNGTKLSVVQMAGAAGQTALYYIIPFEPVVRESQEILKCFFKLEKNISGSKDEENPHCIHDKVHNVYFRTIPVII